MADDTHSRFATVSEDDIQASGWPYDKTYEHTKHGRSCDIFNLGFIIFQCPLTTVHHLYNVYRVVYLPLAGGRRRTLTVAVCRRHWTTCSEMAGTSPSADTAQRHVTFPLPAGPLRARRSTWWRHRPTMTSHPHPRSSSSLWIISEVESRGFQFKSSNSV